MELKKCPAIFKQLLCFIKEGSKKSMRRAFPVRDAYPLPAEMSSQRLSYSWPRVGWWVSHDVFVVIAILPVYVAELSALRGFLELRRSEHFFGIEAEVEEIIMSNTEGPAGLGRQKLRAAGKSSYDGSMIVYPSDVSGSVVLGGRGRERAELVPTCIIRPVSPLSFSISLSII